jgi:hypothetical protein
VPNPLSVGAAFTSTLSTTLGQREQTADEIPARVAVLWNKTAKLEQVAPDLAIEQFVLMRKHPNVLRVAGSTSPAKGACV